MDLEIVQEGPRLFTDWAEVDCFSTSSQEQELIELLEKDGAGLVNGAKDGLTVLRKTTKERNNGPRAL